MEGVTGWRSDWVGGVTGLGGGGGCDWWGVEGMTGCMEGVTGWRGDWVEGVTGWGCDCGGV